METHDLDEQGMNMGNEDISIEGTEPISRLLPYIPPRKPTTKVTKNPNSLKFKVFTPLLMEEVPIEGDLMAWLAFLKMENLDLGNHDKFMQLEPSKYLKSVYYEEMGITRLEPMKWEVGIEHIGLLNMLYFPHFSRIVINAICVRQFLALVHDGCL